MPAHIKAATVSPSGKMLLLEFADGAGAFTELRGANYATTETVGVDGAAGTYALTLAGQVTVSLPRGAEAPAVQSALEALSNVGAGNVTVVGAPGRFVVTFAGTLASTPQALLSVNVSGLSASGSTPPITAGSGAATSADCNDTRYSSHGNWVGTGLGERSAFATGTGANYTLWAFTGLAPGLYLVSASWQQDITNTAAAPYRFFDGSAYRGRTTSDQTAACQPDNPDGTQNLAVVYVSGGTLKVYLTDDTAGRVRAGLLGLAPYDPAADVIDNQPASYGKFTYVGPWGYDNTNGSAYGGSATHNSASTDPATVASWNFRGRPPGSYHVQATWTSGSNRTHAAVYKVYQGSTLLGTFTVDQTVAASGVTFSGTAFQPLGDVTFDTGRDVRVTVSGTAGGYVIADAVRLVPASLSASSEAVAGSSTFAALGGDVTAKRNGAPLPLGGGYWHVPAYDGDPFNAPYIHYPITSPVAPGDSLTVNVPGGVFTTAAGVISANTVDLAATNKAGGTILPDLPSTPRTLRMGWNMGQASPYPVGMYANLMKNASAWSGNPGIDWVFDANGYPTFDRGGAGATTVVVSGGGNIADPRGYPSGGFGHYTLLYDSDGSGGCQLTEAYGLTLTVVSSDTGHATNNKIVYDIQPNHSVSPLPYFAGFYCQVGSTSPGTPATNIRIYPPDVDAANPPKFRPAYVAMMANTKILRTMPTLGANNSSFAEYSDYPTQAQRTYGYPDQRIKSHGITSIGPFTDTTNFVPGGKLPMLVTMDRAHDIRNGEIVIAYPPPGPDGLTVHQHGGGTTRFDYYGFAAYYNPAHMATNQIVIWNDVTEAVTYVDPVFTAGGQIKTDNSVSIPPEDYIELVNLIPDCEAYINLPHAASDDLVTQVFTMVRDRLAPGRRAYCEVANEHWNYGPGFSQFQYFYATGQQNGGGATRGYVLVSGHMHAVARTAMGVRASDYRAAYGSFSISANTTTEIFDVAQAHSFPVDAVLCAAYTGTFPNGETDPGLIAIAVSLDVDQLLDLFERYILSDRDANGLVGHKNVIALRSPSTEFILYEGAFSTGFAGGNTLTRAKQSQAASHHPGLTRVLMYYFQRLQDLCGVTRFTYYAHTHEYANEGSLNVTVYGGFQSWNMLPGPNDGTGPGGYDVRPDIAGVPPGPADLSRSNSVIAQAIENWNLRVTAGTIDPGTGGEGVALAAGTLAAGTATASTVPLTFGTVTGGTGPYSNRLQVSGHGLNSWANVGSPVTGATAGYTASGLTASTQYDFRVITTDSASATATSNVVTATTASGSSGGGTGAGVPRRAFRLPRT